MNKHKMMIIFFIIIGLSSLLYIDFYVENFKFSFAAVTFPLLLNLYDDINSIAFGLLSGASLLAFRWLFLGLLQGVLGGQIYYIFPETLFYIVYGIIFYVIKKSNISRTYFSIFIVSIAADFVSNTLETYIRIGRELFTTDYQILKMLLLVAVVRASLVWLMIIGYRYYKLFLIKEEHDKRYRNLLQLISQLKTEMYWMEKNMDHIEKVMSNAYQLFTEISEEENSENWANEALEIAKDVHEIKKEYGLVVTGIEDILSNKLDDNGMYFNELIDILKESIEIVIKNQQKNISIKFNIGENFYTEKHYYLMSVLRNIIINAIESIKDKGNITVTHIVESRNHVFLIQDNGCGIKEEELNHIFSPGYSTKIDYNTGQVGRGLGLALVENVVKTHFKGTINVNSEYGKGSIFKISIPAKELEDVDR